jgi:hypothetical protein
LILLDQATHLARAAHPEQAADVAIRAITELPPAWRVPLLISKARVVGKTIATTSARVHHRYSQSLREALCQPEWPAGP